MSGQGFTRVWDKRQKARQDFVRIRGPCLGSRDFKQTSSLKLYDPIRPQTRNPRPRRKTPAVSHSHSQPPIRTLCLLPRRTAVPQGRREPMRTAAGGRLEVWVFGDLPGPSGSYAILRRKVSDHGPATQPHIAKPPQVPKPATQVLPKTPSPQVHHVPPTNQKSQNIRTVPVVHQRRATSRPLQVKQ